MFTKGPIRRFFFIVPWTDTYVLGNTKLARGHRAASDPSHKAPKPQPMDRAPWSRQPLWQRPPAGPSPMLGNVVVQAAQLPQLCHEDAQRAGLVLGKLSYPFWYGWAWLSTASKTQLCFLFGLHSYIKLFVLLRRRQTIAKDKFTPSHTDVIDSGLKLPLAFKPLADTLQILLAIKHSNKNWLHWYRTSQQVWKNRRKSNHWLL